MGFGYSTISEELDTQCKCLRKIVSELSRHERQALKEAEIACAKTKNAIYLNNMDEAKGYAADSVDKRRNANRFRAMAKQIESQLTTITLQRAQINMQTTLRQTTRSLQRASNVLPVSVFTNILQHYALNSQITAAKQDCVNDAVDSTMDAIDSGLEVDDDDGDDAANRLLDQLRSDFELNEMGMSFSGSDLEKKRATQSKLRQDAMAPN